MPAALKPDATQESVEVRKPRPGPTFKIEPIDRRVRAFDPEQEQFFGCPAPYVMGRHTPSEVSDHCTLCDYRAAEAAPTHHSHLRFHSVHLALVTMTPVGLTHASGAAGARPTRRRIASQPAHRRLQPLVRPRITPTP
jgi:hypothetical protein